MELCVFLATNMHIVRMWPIQGAWVATICKLLHQLEHPICCLFSTVVLVDSEDQEPQIDSTYKHHAILYPKS